MDGFLDVLTLFTLLAGFGVLVAAVSTCIVLREVRQQHLIRNAYQVRLAEYRQAINVAANSR